MIYFLLEGEREGGGGRGKAPLKRCSPIKFSKMTKEIIIENGILTFTPVKRKTVIICQMGVIFEQTFSGVLTRDAEGQVLV